MLLMKPITTILTFLICTCSFSKNYQTVQSGRTAYFENSRNNIECIRIDSIKFNGDSILYPFYVIQNVVNECFSPSLSSWIGKKVVVRNNGDNVFYNKLNDSILIKTQANLGDNWIAYSDSNDVVVHALVTAVDTMSIWGNLDSVKTIEFASMQNAMKVPDDNLDGVKLKLSKSYGLLETTCLSHFPNINEYSEYLLEPYQLVGLSKPKLGVQNLTWLEVNDYQVGDEIHVMQISGANGFGSGLKERTIKTIYKYLERYDYDNSVEYKYLKTESDEKFYYEDSSSYSYSSDTLTKTFSKSDDFDQLPGYPVYNGSEMSRYFQYNKQFLIKNTGYGADFYQKVDSCWYQVIFDGCMSSTDYYKGLGGPYYICDGGPFSFQKSERKLVYYKKGDTKWGTPLIVNSTDSKLVTNKITITPNPARSICTLSIENLRPGNYNLKLLDLNGKILLIQDIKTTESAIDVSSLARGIYIYQVSRNQQVLVFDKLIVE